MCRLKHLRGRPPRGQVGVLGRRAALLVQPREIDPADTSARHHARRAALHHGHLVAVLVVILADVMRRVARADDDRLLALAVGSGPRESGAVTEEVAPEGPRRAPNLWDVGFPRVAGGLDDVPRVERPGLGRPVGPCPPHHHRPAFLLVVPGPGLDRRLHPYVQFEKPGVRLEEVGQLVLWREDGPPVREGHVREVVIPDRVVQDELVIPLAPVVADGVIGVDDKSGYVEHF